MSSRNMARRVFFVYFSKPVIIARVLCCLFVDLIWRTTYSMLPVEREDLIRVSLARLSQQRALFRKIGRYIKGNRFCYQRQRPETAVWCRPTPFQWHCNSGMVT